MAQPFCTVTRMPTRPPAPALEIRLLGPPEVLVAGRPLQVDTRKAVAILALLAADGRPYARDELAALLWPDSDGSAANGALRRTLSVMRSAIPGEALRIDRARVALDGRGCGSTWSSSSGWPGVGHAATWRPPPRSPAGRSWPASTCATAPTSTIGGRPGRSPSNASCWGCWTGSTAAAEADGDLPAAIDAAARRLDLDPLDEGAHVRLIELYGAAGDPAAAVRQYRACVSVLERELGVSPLATTTARYEAIRDTGPVAPPRLCPRPRRRRPSPAASSAPPRRSSAARRPSPRSRRPSRRRPMGTAGSSR